MKRSEVDVERERERTKNAFWVSTSLRDANDDCEMKCDRVRTKPSSEFGYWFVLPSFAGFTPLHFNIFQANKKTGQNSECISFQMSSFLH